MKRLALALGLFVAGNAWAESIPKSFTASVTLDEYGRAVSVSSETNKIPVVTRAVTTGTAYTPSGEEWQRIQDGLRRAAEKEPAVVWCEDFRFKNYEYNNGRGMALRTKIDEICGMSDGSVIWRRKAKGEKTK